jgi:aspartate/glutamate racemase
MYSIDFAGIKRSSMRVGGKRWPHPSQRRHVGSKRADFIVLCTNTMHKMADAISGMVRLTL